MYSNKFVCCVKANGKILREFNDNVYIPFGSEYSILLKNLNTVRALVNVDIDGNSATDNTSLVINPNSELDLARFIKNGNLTTGNRFKFIERSAQIEEYRGIGVEDGIIRIEFQFEKITPQPAFQTFWTQHNDCYGPGVSRFTKGGDSLGVGLKSLSGLSGPSPDQVTMNSAYSSTSILSRSTQCNAQASVNDAGITVAGSISNQEFKTTSGFITEPEKHVIVLKLLGETAGQPIVEAVTVQTKPKCTTCGKVNKATSKFCTNCGTSLQIV